MHELVACPWFLAGHMLARTAGIVASWDADSRGSTPSARARHAANPGLGLDFQSDLSDILGKSMRNHGFPSFRKVS